MPKEEKQKTPNKPLCVDSLRHNEYYGMQSIFDDLYEKSKNGYEFNDLMKFILMKENILLAYRNIKTNTGSHTSGTDSLTIKDVAKLTPEEVVAKVTYILTGNRHGYRPRAVRRVEIPKPNGDKRPLGIPCIWDRLIQQCIKQVMEPICEAKFSEHSYGFRPGRSVEHAIAETYQRIQLCKLHYVVEFDIKGFFDNVDHNKLLHQIWNMGIKDKTLKSKLKRILKAPIKLPDGNIIIPTKGTPQGGIISPLLANIVLNELDHWVESNWETNPVVNKYSIGLNFRGSPNKGNGYRAMRNTSLKEMYIVRYADDFRIFCRTKSDANRSMIAIKKWLTKRLNLEASAEKTRIVNVNKKYMEFLGFKIKVRNKGDRKVIQSHVSDKQLVRISKELSEQIKNIAKPRNDEATEIRLYNSMVMGIQNYFSFATDITNDFEAIQFKILRILTNRLSKPEGCRLSRSGRPLNPLERKKYGKSNLLRYVKGTMEPIYPIGYIQCRKPLCKRKKECIYTIQGRESIHENLKIDMSLMYALMRQPNLGRSIEYIDNRISLFAAQYGKCAITGEQFTSLYEMHCHHKLPKVKGGTDRYDNLILVMDTIHILIHAKAESTIAKYIKQHKLNGSQLEKVNQLRKLVGNAEIK